MHFGFLWYLKHAFWMQIFLKKRHFVQISIEQKICLGHTSFGDRTKISCKIIFVYVNAKLLRKNGIFWLEKLSIFDRKIHKEEIVNLLSVLWRDKKQGTTCLWNWKYQFLDSFFCLQMLTHTSLLTGQETWDINTKFAKTSK